MALCVLNPIDNRETKINKCALKLLGINRFELSDEDILETVSEYVEPVSIEALLYDTFNNFYVLFLHNIEATCQLLGKKIKCRSRSISIYPLLECYVVDNVYPSLKNEELRDIFRAFGNVYSVTNHHLFPNSEKFSHVLSGKREITFLLPGKELEIVIPINVVHPPYSFNVKKFCLACLTEGHSVLKCPDIEEDRQSIKQDSSDDELEALIKTEYNDFEDTKMENSLPDTQPAVETSKQIERPEITKIAAAVVGTSRQIELPTIAKIATVSPERVDEVKKDGVVADVSQEGTQIKPKAVNTDNLTQVVSTTKVSRFVSGKVSLTGNVKKSRSLVLLPELGEKLINKCCGTSIIEANVFKQLLVTDGRLKPDIVKFATTYLDDLQDLLKFLREVFRRCNEDAKYRPLRGPFTCKVKRIQTVLSDYVKMKTTQ